MIKIKNFTIKIRHLITALAGVGMLSGFIAALCSKKKGASAFVFFSSFAAFVAGLSMETGLVPEPDCMKNLELELESEQDEKLAKLKAKMEKLFKKKQKDIEVEIVEEAENAEEAPEEAPAEEACDCGCGCSDTCPVDAPAEETENA